MRLYITNAGGNWASSQEFRVFGTILTQARNIVPAPVPVNTGSYMVGAQACNFWDNTYYWSYIAPLPTYRPILGYYNEAYDVSVDWQIKMAVDHGISFFSPCWFRMKDNVGQYPVMSSYDQFINSIANSAQYRNDIKWALDWVQDNSCCDGVSSGSDFLNNVVPFWITNYFAKSNYLKINNMPVVTIYNAEAFITQVGSVANAQSALSQARQLAISAGYSGIIFLTVNNVDTKSANTDAHTAGFDYVYAYNIPTFTELMPGPNPTDSQILYAESQAWANWQTYSTVPSIVTVSVGWNGYPENFNSDLFQLTPGDYQTLLTNATYAMSSRASSLQHQVVLLDNWNEFGEGHFIEPAQQYGYGYLDAIAAVFAPGSNPADPIPDISVVPQVIDPVYTLTSVYSGLNLSIATGSLQGQNGDPLVQESPASSNLQRWILDPGPIGYFYMRNVGSNRDASAAGGYQPNQLGVPLQLYQNFSSSMQQWQPILTPGSGSPNYFNLNWDSQAMSLSGGGSQALQPGDPLQTYTYFGSTEQLWKLTKIN